MVKQLYFEFWVAGVSFRMDVFLLTWFLYIYSKTWKMCSLSSYYLTYKYYLGDPHDGLSINPHSFHLLDCPHPSSSLDWLAIIRSFSSSWAFCYCWLCSLMAGKTQQFLDPFSGLTALPTMTVGSWPKPFCHQNFRLHWALVLSPNNLIELQDKF